MSDSQYEDPLLLNGTYNNMPIERFGPSRDTQALISIAVDRALEKYKNEHLKTDYIYYGFLSILLLISATNLSINGYGLVNCNAHHQGTTNRPPGSSSELLLQGGEQLKIMSQKVEYMLRTISHTMPKGLAQMMRKETRLIMEVLHRIETTFAGSMLDLNLVMGKNQTFKLSTGSKKQLCRIYTRINKGDGDSDHRSRSRTRRIDRDPLPTMSYDRPRIDARIDIPTDKNHPVTTKRTYTGAFDDTPPLPDPDNKTPGVDKGKDFSKTRFYDLPLRNPDNDNSYNHNSDNVYRSYWDVIDKEYYDDIPLY